MFRLSWGLRVSRVPGRAFILGPDRLSSGHVRVQALRLGCSTPLTLTVLNRDSSIPPPPH